ncbi:hypothetical protein HU742_003735 [Pseudomonas sp. SWRI102]|uniref:Halovibrin HvnA n=1 Tax=Pseudomonas marvdashtae TaxID=2745500 RepID=A0A923FT43_9PSED|nr:hypothetical protein [Pseudomonas marvdashtae]MBV4550249.1 hypothetical protein [Pseudomonas marvdashtae]
MKRQFYIALFLLLTAGCATHELETSTVHELPGQTVDSHGAGVQGAGTGPEIAAYLTEAYNNVLPMCRNNPSAPSFLCTGVTLRATQHSTQFHFWNPNPTSTGVSFSWLRKDAKFGKLVFGYNNGFILYPEFFKPTGKISLAVLCFFPVDGATDHRPDEGCGQYPNRPNSRPCQSQGITTAAQYIAHFNANAGMYGALCGFDVRDELNEQGARAFTEGVKALGQLPASAFPVQNEFRIKKWAQNLGQTLPIEAVFYIDNTGKVGAQYDQRDFKTQTGIWIPMIKITLPQTAANDAKFEFIPADQAISS